MYMQDIPERIDDAFSCLRYCCDALYASSMMFSSRQCSHPRTHGSAVLIRLLRCTWTNSDGIQEVRYYIVWCYSIDIIVLLYPVALFLNGVTVSRGLSWCIIFMHHFFNSVNDVYVDILPSTHLLEYKYHTVFVRILYYMLYSIVCVGDVYLEWS